MKKFLSHLPFLAVCIPFAELPSVDMTDRHSVWSSHWGLFWMAIIVGSVILGLRDVLRNRK